MGAAHLFVDESKSKGLTLAVAVFDEGQLSAARRGLRSLLLRGQRRIHFTRESPSRRKAILAALPGLGTSAVLVTTRPGLDPMRARECAIRETGLLAASLGAARICVERDETAAALDRRTLFDVQARTGAPFTYGHSRPYDEPLLWAADAVAWSWAKGGPWRKAVESVVTEVIEAGP